MLAAWVDGGLGKSELALVEAHASECTRCQALLATIVQTAPDPSVPAWQQTWLRGWGLRWLVPLAATAAAAVILWVVVPNDKRPDLPEQARAQLQESSSTPPQPDAGRDRVSAPAVGAEQPGAANGTTAAKAVDKTESIGAAEREERKDAASADQKASEPADALQSATARAAPPAAAGAQSQTSANATVALSRQTAKLAPIEITSPDPSVRWRLGGGGAVEQTSNGGTSWEAAPTGVNADLTAGASPSRSVCWLVGRAGTVLLSTDGRTWRRVPFPEITDLATVQAMDAQTATVTTADGRTFRTTDGGTTWN
jgi:hypothetical protein